MTPPPIGSSIPSVRPSLAAQTPSLGSSAAPHKFFGGWPALPCGERRSADGSQPRSASAQPNAREIAGSVAQTAIKVPRCVRVSAALHWHRSDQDAGFVATVAMSPPMRLEFAQQVVVRADEQQRLVGTGEHRAGAAQGPGERGRGRHGRGDQVHHHDVGLLGQRDQVVDEAFDRPARRARRPGGASRSARFRPGVGHFGDCHGSSLGVDDAFRAPAQREGSAAVLR